MLDSQLFLQPQFTNSTIDIQLFFGLSADLQKTGRDTQHVSHILDSAGSM